MSAYAMPGVLFPTVATASADLEESIILQDCNAFSSSCLPEELSSVSSSIQSSEVGIAVKSAKIDPLQLIKSKTQQQKASKGPTRITQLAAFGRSGGSWCGEFSSDSEYESDEEEYEKEELYEEFHEALPPLNNQYDSFSPLESPSSSSTPNEEAIQFEINISYNGREYTATRTLPTIMKLRDELRAELRNQRRRSSRGERVHAADASADEVSIPELPIGSQDEQSAVVTGGFGSGFTVLQSMMQTYCPAIERWLLNVANIVPPGSSRSFTNFLWEPLARNDSDCTRIYKASQRYGSLGVVHEELDETDQDDEEEEEDFF